MLKSDYLLNLNEKQQEAVKTLEGPLLVVAGAGSGKTKVLTSRIANIIKEKKAFPNQILAVTFTNKAAKEMQNRVSKILGSAAVGLSWLGTFHSICAKLLRKHARAVGLNSNFSIIDYDDQIRLIKRGIRDHLKTGSANELLPNGQTFYLQELNYINSHEIYNVISGYLFQGSESLIITTINKQGTNNKVTLNTDFNIPVNANSNSFDIR